MSRTARLIALAMAFAVVSLTAVDAQAHGRWRGGVSIGIGVGVPWGYGPYYAPYYYGPGYYYPGTVLVAPPPVAYAEVPAAAPVPRASAAPEPIFYPSKGQSAAQVEADRQACNRWATTQSSAMSDASVFHRATLACMEGRGYTVR